MPGHRQGQCWSQMNVFPDFCIGIIPNAFRWPDAVNQNKQWDLTKHFGTSTVNMDGLAQDCSNSGTLAMELLQYCAEPSIYPCDTGLCSNDTASSLLWRHTGCDGVSTSLTIVYSPVYSGADQRKHQSSASLAFVRGVHRWPANSPAQMASNAENVSIWWRHHGYSHNIGHGAWYSTNYTKCLRNSLFHHGYMYIIIT